MHLIQVYFNKKVFKKLKGKKKTKAKAYQHNAESGPWRTYNEGQMVLSPPQGQAQSQAHGTPALEMRREAGSRLGKAGKVSLHLKPGGTEPSYPAMYLTPFSLDGFPQI